MGLKDLSEREREVLELIVEGHPNKIIADRLTVSEHCIKFHVLNIYKKVKPKSRAHLATLAVQEQIAMWLEGKNDPCAAADVRAGAWRSPKVAA